MNKQTIKELKRCDLSTVAGGAGLQTWGQTPTWKYVAGDDPLNKVRTPVSAVAAATLIEYEVEDIGP